MRYKKIGRIKEELSCACIGTWGMDNICWGDFDEQVAIDALRTAVDCGVNFVDTAARYGNGVGETIVGKALKDGYRDKIQLLTKFGIWGEYPNGTLVVHRDSSYNRVFYDCEHSLERLDTDHIDFYLQHWPDVNTPIEETCKALNELREKGLIRYIGVCNTDRATIEEWLKYTDVDMVQMQYSMVSQQSREFMEWCYSKGIACVTYGSLGGGILTGIYREISEWPANDARRTFYDFFKEPKFSKCMELLKVMDKISEKTGKPLAQIALNWSTQQPYVTSAINGMNTPAIARENAASFEWALDEEDVILLNNTCKELGLA